MDDDTYKKVVKLVDPGIIKVKVSNVDSDLSIYFLSIEPSIYVPTNSLQNTHDLPKRWELITYKIF